MDGENVVAARPSLVARIFLKDGRLRPVLRVVVYAVAVVVVMTILAIFVQGVVGGLDAVKPGTTPPARLMIILELIAAVAVAGVAVLLRAVLDRRPVETLGMSPSRGWLRLLAIGVAIGAGMQAFVFALEAALGYAHVAAVAPGAALAAMLPKFALLFAAVAVTEEVSLRGYVFQNLIEEWGVAPACAITAALFALAHLGNPNSHAELALTVTGLAAYALWACASVLWTRSLWLIIGVHFAWNVFEGPIFGFPVSGLDFGTTALTLSLRGPAWFTGGAFGPESGASSLLALAAGFAVLLALHRAGALRAAGGQKSSSFSSD